jgi:hypothetical protein
MEKTILSELPIEKQNQVTRVNKALTTVSFLNGGRLDPSQEKTYQEEIRGTNDMMSAVDLRFTDRMRGKIDKMFFGSNVLRKGAEDTNFVNLVDPKFKDDEYSLAKLTGAFNISYESMIENIESDNFKSHLINSFLEKAARDVSWVAVNGDTGSADLLLSAMNGFRILSNNAHIYDAAGAEISRGVFHSSFRTMPVEFRRDKSSLRFFANSILQNDYQEVLGNRATGYGDVTAQGGNLAKAIGVPFLTCDEIRDDYAVAYGAATRAEVVGTTQGPFTIVTGSNDAAEFDIDNTEGGAPTAITIPSGVYTANELAYVINVLLTAIPQPAGMSTDGNGRMKLSSLTTGGASEVEVQAVANDCYTTLGLTVAVTPGAAAGANSINYGTYMWLTDPKNFRVYVLSQFRTDWDYVGRSDRWEFTMQHYAIPVIVEPMGLVRTDNIKLSDY